MAKYHNRKVTIDGITYDSRKEARRHSELLLLERAGAIQNLRCQVKFDLLPSQRIGGKVVERPVSYIADFVYEENGQKIVEDTKGMKTKDYIIKRKLMLWIHGIRIKEV